MPESTPPPELERPLVCYSASKDPNKNEFWECEACRTKPGTPLLCKSCLHNRAIISKLWTEIDRLRMDSST